MNKINRNRYFLPVVIFINSLIMLFNALFLVGRVNGLLILFIGGFTFSLVYSVPMKYPIMNDLFLVLIIILQSGLSSFFLFTLCKFFSEPVCVPAVYKTQVFTNFAFPFYIILFLWFILRAPVLFTKRKNNK